MKRLIIASPLIAVAVLGAYQNGAPVQYSAAFVTRLGTDTLASLSLIHISEPTRPY